ncbi:protein immune deficiency [Phlebotomus argentipes]|uniref:protein immune deficiency n=1 Tax=Phlebotomus argentipes TaxID=94469 RepID=UPI00289323E5|nr:protein immune deficiency [Phlebotomus argentipes]
MKIPDTRKISPDKDSQSAVMSKVSEIFANIFSRSAKVASGSASGGILRSDAGPMAPRTDDEIEEAALEERNNSEASFPSIPPTPSMEIVRQESQISIPETPSPLLPVASTSRERKNQLDVTQVNNTQACNVFQFSNVNNLHIGSVYNISTEPGRISPRQRSGQSGERIYRKTPSIDAMMKSQEKLEHEHIEIIATHLGEDWRNVARDLGYSQGQIDQLMEDNHISGVKEVIYQMILGWTQEDTTATLGRITEVLWRRRPHQEVVYYLKEYWKKANRAKSRRQSEISTESTD